jgi:hypothetical protein
MSFGWPARSANAVVPYVFNVTCPISHFNQDDPIVFPAASGLSHRHAFYGNTTTDAFSTTATLTASKSTCERGFAQFDHSAYWVPTLYRKTPGGTFQEVNLSGDNQYLSAYYRRSGDKVVPFPKGLRMVSGDPHATSPQSGLNVAWRCKGAGNEVDNIPNCDAGSTLQAEVSFPDCWDGKHLDSPDHRSHMTYALDAGTCPQTHPVKLPQLTFEITFDFPAVPGSTYELSSGGTYSLHGDFFAAWDDRVQSALVNSCLNEGRYCENPDEASVNLAAAGPVMSVPEPVVTSSSSSPPGSTSAPAPAPTQSGHVGQTTPAEAAANKATAAESTGPSLGVVSGIVIAVLAVAAAMSYGLRRRSARRGRRGAAP